MTPADLAFDLIVLGGGPAGTSGASTATALGYRVVPVEQAPQVGRRISPDRAEQVLARDGALVTILPSRACLRQR
jgi:flavin-dependent dehydrogenase